MNSNEDEKWQSLLARSMPTFAGAAAPPYGFVTSTLARLRDEQRQRQEFESIGWRAMVVSLVTLVIVCGVSLGMHLQDVGNLEPGVRTMMETANVPIA